MDLMRVTCQGIARTACDLAYINTTLWGVPVRIIQGDTLRNTVQNEWRNIHWFTVGEPERERIQKIIELLQSKPEPPAEPTTTPTTVVDNHGQQGWTFD